MAQVAIEVFEGSEESFEAGGSSRRRMTEFGEVAGAEELGLGDDGGTHGFVLMSTGGPCFVVD